LLHLNNNPKKGGKVMEIVNFSQVSRTLVWECAKLYCEIWKEPPWNEDFWRPEAVTSDIEQQLKKTCAEGFLCLHNGVPVGFSWAYAVTRSEMSAISGSKKLDCLFLNHDQVFYIDELAVSQSFRRRGIGEKLTKAILLEVKKYGISVVTLRTNKKAHAARATYRKIGFKDLSIEDEEYPDRTYWVLEL
jgi:ribosomal protein S18 acetylase RimI-like enzyme